MTDNGFLDRLITWLWYWSPPAILTTVIVAVLGVLAIRTVVIAFRGVPVLGPPRCARCGHPVHPSGGGACDTIAIDGLDRASSRCAECGQSLVGAGRSFGWRRRSGHSWRRAILAVTLIAAATMIGTRLAGRAEMLAERAILRGAFAAGARGPAVLDEFARALSQGLADGADEGEITDEFLVALGSAPMERIRGSHGLRVLLVNLGSRAIVRQDSARIEALAEAIRPPPVLRVRQRHHASGTVRIDMDADAGHFIYNPAFVPLLLAEGTWIDDGGVSGPPVPLHRGKWSLPAPDAIGVHRLRIDWRQAIVPTVVSPQPDVVDLSNAVWMRSGTFETTVEVMSPGQPVFEHVDAASADPWPSGEGAIQHLELRDIDDRMLVSLVVTAHVRSGIAHAGRWIAIQDGIERRLHREDSLGNADRAVEQVWSVRFRGDSIVSPRIDPSRSFHLRFEPRPADAEDTSSCTRCWVGTKEIVIEPDSLVRDPAAVDPTWVWAGQ